MGLLRLLFALSVLSAHTGPLLGSSLIGGKMAVQSFFMLSGFYMSFILSRKYIGTKKSYKLFISNRFLRIYPTYFVVFLLSVAVSYIFFITGGQSKFDLYKQYIFMLNPLAIFYLAISNVFIFGMDLVMFLGIDKSQGTLFFTNNYLASNPLLHNFIFIPQGWTLSLEFIFYIIAPFLVRRKLWIIGLIILLSLFIRFYLYSIGLHREPWTNRFFPAELAFFLFGIIAYRIYTYIVKKKYTTISKSLLLILVLFTLFYSFIPFNSLEGINGMQLSYFAVLFTGIPFIFQLTIKSNIDRILGMLSYPVYISHIFIADILYNLGQGKSKFITLEAVFFTIILSVILVYFIERPIDRFRQKRLIINNK